MKASRANIKALKAQTNMADEVMVLNAKVDLILAHLGIEVPAEGAVNTPQAEPDAEQANGETQLTAAAVDTQIDNAFTHFTEALQDDADASPDASQRSQLEENRQRVGSRGAAKTAGKQSKAK
jgi:hypothetical protein